VNKSLGGVKSIETSDVRPQQLLEHFECLNILYKAYIIDTIPDVILALINVLLSILIIDA